MKDVCSTCSLSQKECPGHMGHIELNVPVYNPFLFGELFKLLRRKCFFCHRFKVRPYAGSLGQGVSRTQAPSS